MKYNCQLLSSILTAAALIPYSLVQARPASEGWVAGNNTKEAPGISCTSNSTAKPFYAIARDIAWNSGVLDAIKNGANAVEIDVTPHSDKWYSDGSGKWATDLTKKESVEDLFKTIAAQRKAGKPITFVWLDLKEPDRYSDPKDKGSIENLRKLARDILQPEHVKVLYGFYGQEINGRAFKVITEDLNKNEAIDVDGPVAGVEHACFDKGKLKKDDHKCVMSRGYYNVGKPLLGPLNEYLQFGNCNGTGTGICSDLNEGAKSKSIQKVFGWTISEHKKKEARQMMGEAKVDGLLYGFKNKEYKNDVRTRAAFKIISDWIADNKDKRCLATASNSPW